ncbi:MAG TPA: helix-turn-helix transcriptional regulator [Spirochaetia bacterium]|nr:helix-turn-helix transcriptional regulator [Spirochaetia bacterium]
MQGYVEFEPEPRLISHVVCLWRHTFVGKGPHSHRILPDGCVDIVLMGDSEPMVVGPDTKAALISFDKPTEILGIRLMPGVAASVLREDVSNLRDQTIPLAEFRPGSRGTLHDRLLSASEWKQRLNQLQGAVFDRPPAVDRRVTGAVAVVAREPHLRIDGLASTYGLTSRQLLRLFEAHVGYGPKTLARVFRLQRALAVARRGSGTFADLAFAAGYADQSHMNREFKQLSSSIPSRLLPRASTVTMSDLFKTAFAQI